ncbi:glycerophosphodiester phosphodiesterase [Streptomyces aidingensis]|uniref:glycerophosphodiester phosphodiesterase n=1 Tax=Streptomyces aidingensis TaxID=910347 RepID=UPI003CCB7F04
MPAPASPPGPASSTASTGSTGSTASAASAGPAASRPGPVVVAHRGASGYAPENTLAAADAAAALGAPWVEADVQRTRDGVLVLMHDTTLERTTDAEVRHPDRAPWEVSGFSSAELAGLDAGGWFGERFAGEPVPTLTAFLRRLARHGQRLLLEIKAPERYPGIEAEIVTVLREEGWLTGAALRRGLVVQSFSADSVRTVHELHPGIRTGFLGRPEPAELPVYAAFCDQINPRHTTLTAEYVAAVQALAGPHGSGLEVLTWTVNDAAAAVRAASLGVDGIITDHPDVVRRALTPGPGRRSRRRRRAGWPGRRPGPAVGGRP